MQGTLQDSLVQPLAWFNSGGILANVGAATYLNHSNHEALLLAEAVTYGHADNAQEWQQFVNYIYFDAAAFNLADTPALNTALDAGNVLLVSDMETYAAAYTP